MVICQGFDWAQAGAAGAGLSVQWRQNSPQVSWLFTFSSRLPPGPVPGNQQLFGALKALYLKMSLEYFNITLKFGEKNSSNLMASAFHVTFWIIFLKTGWLFIFWMLCCHHLIILSYVFLILSVRPCRHSISKSWSLLGLLYLIVSSLLTCACCSSFCSWLGSVCGFSVPRSYLDHMQGKLNG